MYLRKSVVPAVSATANASAITCVQFTNAPKIVNVWLELGRGRKRANAPPTGAAPGHDPEQDQREPERPHHLDEGIRAAKAGPKISP